MVCDLAKWAKKFHTGANRRFGAVYFLSLILAAGPVFAQSGRTPVFQSGAMIPGDLSKFITNGMVGDVGGLNGDALSYGVNPFAINDKGATALCANSGAATGKYEALCWGHLNGEPTLIAEAYGGAEAPTNIFARLNGVLYPLINQSVINTTEGLVRLESGISDTMTLQDGAIHWIGNVASARAQAIPACQSGTDAKIRRVSDDAGIASLYPITLTPASGTVEGHPSFSISWNDGVANIQCDGVSNWKVMSASVATPAANTVVSQTFPDDSSSITVTAEGLGFEPQSIHLVDLIKRDRFAVQYTAQFAPQIVDADQSHQVHWAILGGQVFWDIQHLALGEKYTFVTDGTTEAFLDPGTPGVFSGWGFSGKMLHLLPNQSATIVRLTAGIFSVVSLADPTTVNGAIPFRGVVSADLVSGVYTIPAGSGIEYSNITNGAATFDLSQITEGVTYYVSNNLVSTTTLDPVGGNIQGLLVGAKATIGPGVRLSVVRTGVTYVLGEGTGSLSSTTGFTRDLLPSIHYNGMTVFCSNCRKPSEAVGLGSGIQVFWDAVHSNWYTFAGVVSAI